MPPVMQLKSVSKTYRMGQVMLRALREVCIHFDEGEMTAIIGSSGSGKSTMMHILGCLDRPSEGEYLLDGRNVADLDDDSLSHIRNQKIGFVFQAFNLIPHLNIVENVELPMFYMGTPRRERIKRIMGAIERVGLKDRAHHAPSELSGGERQRCAIARAIVHGPRVILADEPTGNLDSRTGADVLDILHDLHDEGRTLIIVTHDNKIANALERRVTVKDGLIAEDSRGAV
jgi:putative ABC transport system ATP-binding protein